MHLFKPEPRIRYLPVYFVLFLRLPVETDVRCIFLALCARTWFSDSLSPRSSSGESIPQAISIHQVRLIHLILHSQAGVALDASKVASQHTQTACTSCALCAMGMPNFLRASLLLYVRPKFDFAITWKVSYQQPGARRAHSGNWH